MNTKHNARKHLQTQHKKIHLSQLRQKKYHKAQGREREIFNIIIAGTIGFISTMSIILFIGILYLS